MTQEEKARAYDEALERVNSKWHYKNQPCFVDVAEIFPELRESEDERIKDGLIALLKFGLEDGSAIAPGSNVTKEQALAWLEKQGAQKSVFDELEMTLSVSEEGYLRSNLEKLIKEFKEEQQ